MQDRKQAPKFDFSASFGQTLKDYEHTPEASQADFERAQKWRENHDNENLVTLK